MSLKDKIALVTGGSRGIGKHIVKVLAASEATVVFTYFRNEEEALKLESSIRADGQKAMAIKTDIGNFDEAKSLITEVTGKYETIDILVNNAGITQDKTLLKMSREDWQEVLDTNLSGVFNVTRNVIFTMLKNKTGRIINISSTSGIQGLAGQTNYSASKAGIIGFTRALAKEAAPFGVLANVVAPAGVETEMLDKLPEQAKAAMLSVVPMKRFCQPEEVANVVLYLASDSPAYLTGTVLVLDGGMGVG